MLITGLESLIGISCGVMAIKAICFFAKHTEFMDELFSHHSHDSREGSKTVDVMKLPAGLIKLCQDPALINDHPDREKRVNKQLTFNQYLSIFSRDINREDTIKTVNTAAFLKRYKYLMSYIKDHTFATTVPNVAASASVPKGQRKRRSRMTAAVAVKKLSVARALPSTRLSVTEKNRCEMMPEQWDHTYCSHFLFSSHRSQTAVLLLDMFLSRAFIRCVGIRDGSRVQQVLSEGEALNML